ncbi:hypothetical protein IFM89_008097 [Coptis chinensis]|uniref:UDP-glycosyltransferase n=1 Tax=Coptis chinensis TaxID=261450 RepID=A0A835MEJ1_9MAGN|nr:hypothetical protein IFM89_008097 [Coptis chinensis]
MTTIGDQPHVLVVPYPAQGHVMPLMRLSYCLVERGVRITFVNTEDIHSRLVGALPEDGKQLDHIHLASISDGLTPKERKDSAKLHNAVLSTLPTELEKLIKNTESTDKGKIECIISDVEWAVDVAKRLGMRIASFFPSSAGVNALADHIPKLIELGIIDKNGNVARRMGIRQAVFFPASAGAKALLHHIPKLIEMGIIDENGTPKKDEMVVWSPTMPTMKASHFTWNCMGDFISPEIIFQTIHRNNQHSKSADWVFCNTFDELEHAAIALVPKLLPIGPLPANNQLGNLWPEDSTCLSWLDQQAAGSVIYIAFGSTAILDQRQFNELALGLELLGRPFLWVFRSESDLYGRHATTFPDGFQERVSHIGKIVSWAPQHKVLAHPSIACFVSHCGWNSTIEGVSNGVPFISWPYFADQFFDATYITEIWRVGLGLKPDEDGIISRDEIKRKLDQLIGDKEIKGNALKLKEMAMKSVGKGGSSTKNLELFLKEVRSRT